MQLYRLKNCSNVFVSLDGEWDVQIVGQQKWGNLRTYEIFETTTRSGFPVQAYRSKLKSFLLDSMEFYIDLEKGPEEVELPRLQQY